MKRYEIGSEFCITYNEEIKKLENRNVENIFNYLEKYNSFYFDSGRSAVYALRDILNFKKVLLPDYICESVRMCFSESNVIYYHINENFQIDWDDLLDKSTQEIDILYLHFFNGYIGTNYDFRKLNELKEQKHFVIIEDTTHSFFTSVRTVGDYCICSLRKWFPVPDGGVLYTKIPLSLKKYSANQWAEKKAEAMINKGYYLEGQSIEKREFLEIFSEVEQLLVTQNEPYAISKISINILENLDINTIIRARCRNHALLNERLSCKKIATGGKKQVPLFFTVSMDNRDLLRKYLIEKNIYCAVHWPLFKEIEQIEETVSKYKRELSIPIDQRYDLGDMEYIANEINKFAEINNGRYMRK